MVYKDLYDEVISISEEITPLNIEIKLEELLEHDSFKKNKIHLQLIREYLNDDDIFKRRIEKFINITPGETNSIMVNTDLEPLFIFPSIEFFLFDDILNKDEKKELIISYLNILDLEFINGYGGDNFMEAQELLSKYRLIYHKELLDLGTDNLKNLETINEILNVLNNQENVLKSLDESLSQLIETPKKFYSEKKEYFKDAYFIESEIEKRKNKETDNITDQKLKPLEDLWLPNAKISLQDVLKKGIERKLWDKNYNIITKRNSLFGSGKSLLSSLSISLKNFAYPDTIDHKILGNAFCVVFNITINKETKEPFKSFATGNPKHIREFKMLLNIR